MPGLAERLGDLSILLDHLHEGIQVIDHDWQYVYINHAAATQGRAAPEDLLGRSMMACYPGIEGTEMFRLLEACRDTGQPQELLNQFVYPDGRTGWFELRIQPTPQGLLILSIDVTQRRSLEVQLRQALRLESLGRFAGGMAHDFNNLLTVITGYAAFLEEDLAGTVHVPDIVQIRSAVERGARLTGQLLAFSRRKPSNPEPFDVEAAVGGVLELTQRVLGEGVEVVRAWDSGAARVRMDPGAFEQVLMNLILNARDAMGGHGRLLVEVSRCALDADQVAVRGVALPPGDYARVSITDNGPGMTAEVLDQVFDTFFTTKQETGGTGLGLASAYGLVRQADGILTAYAEPGLGATFRVYLPAVSDEAERGAPAPAPVLPRGQGRILVIDDDAAISDIVSRTLFRSGYTVEVAESVAAAREIVDGGFIPAALITDVMLPHESGVMGARELQARIPGLRILFMSGYSELGLLQATGADPFIEKPFSPVQIARRVAEVLAR